MLSCKIISVNPFLQSFKTTQQFGHKVNDDGTKDRYIRRREKINNFLRENKFENIEIDFFDAITPNDFSIENDRVIFENKTFDCVEKNPFNFYMANLLSHYKIWEMEEDTLILEDDLILTKNLIKSTVFLIEEYKNASRENSILYLQRSVPWLQGSDKSLIYNQYISDNLGTSTQTDFSGTAAYFITKETKKQLLNNIQPFIACDRYLIGMMHKNLLEVCIPKNINNMFSLDQETMWL